MMQATVRQTEIWDAYYAEMDAKRRKELLTDGCEMEPDNPLNALRRELWELRYLDPKNPEQPVDRLLWQCVNLLCIYKMSRPRMVRKSSAKEVRDAIQTMGFEQAERCGESGRQELYREFRNAAHRYFSVSSTDKSYRKKYFGIKTMNHDEYKEKLAKDAWCLSKGIAERFQLQRELEVFSNAVKDEFFAFMPDAQDLWDRCSADIKK
ncbi:MAG: DUF5664 domain-containing protein [Oscillospiraceae bacterium]